VSEAKWITPRAKARRKRKGIVQDGVMLAEVLNSSCAGLTRASIFFAKRFLRRSMDCRVKPGNDRGIAICSSALRPSNCNQQVYKMAVGAISIVSD
jgi:hypothetical protein